MASIPAPHTPSLLDQLGQLRDLALRDAVHYNQVVPAIVNMVGPTAVLPLRRWGADFLAETLASPVLEAKHKQELCFPVLPILRSYLEADTEDASVIKSSVQAATSMYPLVFKYIILNPSDAQTWQHMQTIKSNILRRMDSAPAGVKMCCIKFIQRVVHAQTPGVIADPRRGVENELSLSLVPRDHPLIPPPNLEAEALGLLDRLLMVFQENSSDALFVTATLNSVATLVRDRPSVAQRVLNAILNFNPFQPLPGPLTPRIKVNVKSMERTVRAFLKNFLMRNQAHPIAGRIQGHLDRLAHSRVESLDEIKRKRSAPVEPTDGLDGQKRQRLAADVPLAGYANFDPHGPIVPISVAQLFTYTNDQGAKGVDVQAVPFDIVSQIIAPLLTFVDQGRLTQVGESVKTHYDAIMTKAKANEEANKAVNDAAGVEASSASASGPVEQVYNALDSGTVVEEAPEVGLGAFVIPQPPPLSEEEASQWGKETVVRVVGMVNVLDESKAGKGAKSGFNRLAATHYDRDSWVTVVARLATRGSTGLEDDDKHDPVKKEGQDLAKATANPVRLEIREALFKYVLHDFRRRIDVAISWLNEEWYNDKLQGQSGRPRNYEVWVRRLLDGIVPYLDAKDKILIRFLSEVPEVDAELLERVKKLAIDPERVSLAVNSIHYLILFRPPIREICIDALEDLWRNYDDARASASKLLTKWRPGVLQQGGEDVKPVEAQRTAVVA